MSERQIVHDRLAEVGLADNRFIDVKNGEKGSHDHTTIPMPDSGNYAIYAKASDQLVLIDIDDYEEIEDVSGLAALTELPQTFEQESAHDGTHRLFKVPITDDGRLIGAVLEEIFGKMNLKTSFGEVRVDNQYVVGAGSYLNDGCKYRVQSDNKIASVDAMKLVDILAKDPKVERVDVEHPDPEDVATPDPDTITNSSDGDGCEDTNFDSVDDRLEFAFERDDKLARLWDGDYRDYRTRHGIDRSEAESALAMKLAFWFEKDRQQVGRLMDRANTKKWSERDDDSYRDSILSAVDAQDETFDPDETRHGSDSESAAPVTPQTVDTTTGGQTDETTEEADTSETSESGDADADADEDADADTPGTDWEHILKGYRSADSADDRLPFRYDAVSLLDDSHAWRNIAETDVLWSYDSDTGTFHEDGEQEVRARLVERLKERFKTQESNEVAAQLRGRNTVSEDQMGGPANKIACENGVLDISEHPPTLEDHDPSHNFLSGLGTAYDATAECPRFEQFLAETVPDVRDRRKLQEYAGYCLMHWQLPQHKTLFLVGPTASGKSTFLDTIRAMLGSNSTASLSPQQMTSERFGGAELYGAWANIRNDINSDMIENTGTFKELAAGDPVKAEKKYKDPFMFSPTTKHLFSANQLPEAATDDEAFYRRILLVAFPETIPRPERDPALDDKLEAELAGVLNWALEGLDRMMEQGRFTGDRPPGETQMTWEKWCNSVKRFVQVCVEEAGDEELPKGDAYQAYQGFCEDEGIPVETQHKFTRDFKSYSGFEDGRTYVGAGSGRERLRVFYDCQFTGRGQEYLDTHMSDDDDDSPTGAGNDGVTDY